MPRLARQIAESGYYHVILRGNGRRILFEDDSDRSYFLDLLKRYGDKYGLEYLAWCLMDNHVHLLICDADFVLSQAMHDIGFVFAQYYNSVNDHVGSVFQNRYTSIPIESEEYLLEVMRYIHNNPVRGGITTDLHYRWSSYDDYLYGGILTSTELILELLGGTDGFKSFCEKCEEAVSQKIDRDCSGRLSDSDAIEIAKKILGEDGLSRIERVCKRDRDQYLLQLSEAGLGVQQIARLTGLGRSIVSRAKATRIKKKAFANSKE